MNEEMLNSAFPSLFLKYQIKHIINGRHNCI